MRTKQTIVAGSLMLALTACASQPPKVVKTRASSTPATTMLASAAPAKPVLDSVRDGVPADATAMEVVLYALGLLNINYRWGGANPESGLDCSGMVSYIYGQAAGLKVQGSASDIARKGRPIQRDVLRPGDLVFFNTQNRPFSHVGVYIGDARFVHAPSTNGRIRIDRLSDRYYAQRFEAARTFFD